MKLLFIFFFLVVMLMGGKAYAQQVTIRQKNIALTDVFREIHKQTGYGFIYSDKLLAKMAPVNLDLEAVTIEAALQKCFENHPLAFFIENKIVTIVEKATNDRAPIDNSTSLTARVVSRSGIPISAATVRIRAQKAMTMTNYLGVFSVKSVYMNDILEVSCIGFETKRIAVNSIAETIMLETSESKMDEVQVIAYGQTNNRLNTGSVTTISSKELTKTSGPNVLESLAGLVPGLSITPIGSGASANYRISLRGMNTLGTDPNLPINAINSPLILLDGLPLSVGITALNEGGLVQSGLASTDKGQSAIFNINPDDIESISVLKDADATSIYGSMGANGVILITSKKPQPGKTQAHAMVRRGISLQGKKIELLNTTDYLAMRKEAFANDKVLPTALNAYDLLIWNKDRSIDWQKKLLESRPYTAAQLSLSGGKNTFSYRLNSSYYYNDLNPGLSNPVTNLYKEQRATTDLTLSKQSNDGRLKINFRGAYAAVHNNQPSSNPESFIYLAPNAPDLLTGSGDLNWPGWRAAKGFPLSVLGFFRPYEATTHDKDLNGAVSYQLTDALEINAIGSYRQTSVDQLQIDQSLATTDPLLASPVISSRFGKSKFKIWSSETNLKYSLQLQQSNLQFLAGVQYNRNNQDNNYIVASGWPSGVSQESISGATDITTLSNEAEIRMASFYGRATYNYLDKYIVNLTGRRDGSSNFGDNKKYGNFGSVGTAWIISREPWLQSLIQNGIFSFAKLRASLGTTGLAVSRPYTYTATVTGNVPYQGLPANSFIQPDNPNVKWAQSRKFDMALDLGFFKDRLLLSFNYYHNRTSDIITLNPVTTVTGFKNLLYNQSGAVDNVGKEATLSFRSDPGRKLKWAAGANISFNKNKLTAFPNLDQSLYFNFGYRIDQSVNRFYITPKGTVDPQTGFYISKQQDLNYYTADPDFTGGVQALVNYQGFEISFNFTFSRQKGLNTIIPVVVPGASVNGLGNQPALVLQDRWRFPGDLAAQPRLSAFGSGSVTSYENAGYLGDASFISLKNARFRYSVDEKLAKLLKLSALSASITGHNLLYITKFKGINPELPFDGTYLIRRLFDLSIDVTF